MKVIRRYHLPQSRHTIKEKGWVGGIGYRRGYVRGQPWGTYVTKHRDSACEEQTYQQYYGNIMVLIEALERHCQIVYPEVYQERLVFIEQHQLDSITVVSLTLIVSCNTANVLRTVAQSTCHLFPQLSWCTAL